MSGLPTDSSHLSDLPVELMLEQYGGETQSQFAKASVMRQYVKIRPVRGTDTITNNRVGKTDLIKLVPGVRPDVTPTKFGKVSLTVDTVILARDNRALLNEFQAHFDVRMELAQDHGKMIGKFFDEAFIIQAIKGSKMAAPSNLDGAIGAGHNYTLASAGDDLDPDKLYAGIEAVVVEMKEQEVPIEDMIIFVRPTHYAVLNNHDKLGSKEFSYEDGGNFSKMMVKTAAGVRIEESTRIPTAAITNHFLSNANNGNAYDLTSAEAKAVAVVLHPKGLLAGETIPLSSDIWFNREEKQWFIDSWLAFGVTVSRPDACGAVFKA